MPAAALQKVASSANWRAKLELGFEARPQRTVLAHRKRYGPLSVQRPFYPEAKTCHVYILHPPGGVVGGDELCIEVDVKQDAHALITTPGATKFYRSNNKTARQNVRLNVSGALEWLPQENILFRGAELAQSTQIDLQAGARFIGMETHCFGRPAIDEQFDRGRANIRMQLTRDGVPLHIESMRISPDLGRNGPASLRGYPVTGTLYASPVNPEQLETLRSGLADAVADNYFSLTLIDDVLIARFLGASTRLAQQRFIALWTQLRPMVMHQPACIPRIWNT